jgi:hypothetical protein
MESCKKILKTFKKRDYNKGSLTICDADLTQLSERRPDFSSFLSKDELNEP